MKKIIILLSVVFGLIGMGCSMGVALFPDVSEYENWVPAINININYSEISKKLENAMMYKESTNKVYIAAWYVSDYMQYTKDKEGDDYWQTPEETYNRMEGDCEDAAIFLLAILKIDDNFRGQTLISIGDINSSYPDHACILDRNSGIIYNCGGTVGVGIMYLSNNNKTYKIYNEFSYAEVMYQAYTKTKIY